MSDDPIEQFVAQSWRPTLSYIGADGLPPTGRSGNVLRPSTTLKLSFRLPPTCDAPAALAAVERVLTAEPPGHASVTFTDAESRRRLERALARALAGRRRSMRCRRQRSARSAGYFGEGGSIPFMGMLGARFPAAQFVVTGALVPGSNAHGPDEFLHLPTARRVTECIARLLGAHVASPR